MFNRLIKAQLINSKSWGLLIVLFAIASCNQAEKGTKDVFTKTIEKTITAKSGSKVDLGSIDDISNTSAAVSFSTADKVFLKSEEKLKGTLLFQKENDVITISFQISDENGKALISTINHVPENFTLPLIAKFAVSNSYDGVTPVATFMFMQASESVVNSPTPFKGTLKILKLSAKEITFEMEAKGGEPMDAENPSAWKSMSAKGVIKSPLIQTFGIDKKDILR